MVSQSDSASQRCQHGLDGITFLKYVVRDPLPLEQDSEYMVARVLSTPTALPGGPDNYLLAHKLHIYCLRRRRALGVVAPQDVICVGTVGEIKVWAKRLWKEDCASW